MAYGMPKVVTQAEVYQGHFLLCMEKRYYDIVTYRTLDHSICIGLVRILAFGARTTVSQTQMRVGSFKMPLRSKLSIVVLAS